MPITISLVEDYDGLRETLAALLNVAPGLRCLGAYSTGEAHVAGAGRLALEDQTVASGVTEFSIPRLMTYAVIDLRR